MPSRWFRTPSPSFVAVSCFICGCRRIAVTRHLIIDLVLVYVLLAGANRFSKTCSDFSGISISLDRSARESAIVVEDVEELLNVMFVAICAAVADEK